MIAKNAMTETPETRNCVTAYDGRSAGDDADDEVVHNDEREEEGDALQNRGLERKDTSDVDEDRAECCENDQSDGCIERTPTNSSLRIDEQRADPGKQNERNCESIQLQPDRQIDP